MSGPLLYFAGHIGKTVCLHKAGLGISFLVSK